MSDYQSFPTVFQGSAPFVPRTCPERSEHVRIEWSESEQCSECSEHVLKKQVVQLAHVLKQDGVTCRSGDRFKVLVCDCNAFSLLNKICWCFLRHLGLYGDEEVEIFVRNDIC